MLKNVVDKNCVLVAGKITGLKYDFTFCKEKFYKAKIYVNRMSDTVDELPVVIPEKIMQPEINYEGKFAEITGEYRSINKNGRLILYIYATSITAPEYGEWSLNIIDLTGCICKVPTLRKTPKQERDIADLLLAVNRAYKKSCYIPCIAWGKDAKYVSELSVGTKISLNGRIQSREYGKKISDGEYEIRTAYEVSIKEVGKVDTDDKD